MNVKVTLLDGSVITPAYDPEHANSVLDFYYAKYFAKEILAFEVF